MKITTYSKYKILSLIVFLFFIISGCNGKSEQPVKITGKNKSEQSASKNSDDPAKPSNDSSASGNKLINTDSDYIITMKRDLLCLFMSYSSFIQGIEKGSDTFYLKMKTGKKIAYDDKKQKTFDDKLNNADLQDMMELIYPLEKIKTIPEKDMDPGRFRNYELLKSIYGSSQEQIEAALQKFTFGASSLQFINKAGAYQHIVSAEKIFQKLIKDEPSTKSFIYPSSGTYVFKMIAKTNLLSMHSFGIAIDLAKNDNDYWQWVSREKGQKRLDSYPQKIAEVLEKNYFIWGGKWAHFDIMHYEYRPEIILKAQCFSEKPIAGKPWHEGYNKALDNEGLTARYIKIIDGTVK